MTACVADLCGVCVDWRLSESATSSRWTQVCKPCRCNVVLRRGQVPPAWILGSFVTDTSRFYRKVSLSMLCSCHTGTVCWTVQMSCWMDSVYNSGCFGVSVCEWQHGILFILRSIWLCVVCTVDYTVGHTIDVPRLRWWCHPASN